MNPRLTRLARLGTAYTGIASGILTLGVLVSAEDGALALVQILAPHLALACLILVPVAALAQARSLALALVAITCLFGIRFGAEWWSPAAPDPDGSGRLRVEAWNLEAGERAGPEAIDLLTANPGDIVAVEELTPAVAAAIDVDPTLGARYPFRALFPSDGVAGIGLLSRFPIRSPTYDLHPVRLEARIDLPDGPLVVLAAHPFPALIYRVAGIPSGINPTDRNHGLDLLRARVVELAVAGDRVLLLGDFNTAPTEPAFGRLVGGLHDAHAEVGSGPGWTWRPARFAFLGIGLLRIDLILTTSGLEPLTTSVTCPAAGDHCLVQASLAYGVAAP